MEKTQQPLVFREDDFDRLPPPSQVDEAIVRRQTTYWKDVWRTFKKNRTAVISLAAIACSRKVFPSPDCPLSTRSLGCCAG